MYCFLGGRFLYRLKTNHCPHASVFRMCSSVMNSHLAFNTLKVTQPETYVYHVQLNRPEKLNALNGDMWREIGECFEELGTIKDCRSIVLSGNGKIFSSGIDLSDLTDLASIVTGEEDVARKCRALKHKIIKYQSSMTSLEKCPKPVIAAVHGGCVGGGIDLICSADIRYCSMDAWFQVKEVDVGLAADVGTLQRLPKIVGSESLVRELCFTARKFCSDEAKYCGLVSRILPNQQSLLKTSIALASLIAEKSPVAVQATKESLVHSRDHSVQEGLNFMATLNSTLLQSQDLMTAAVSALNKEKPSFSDL